MTNEHNSHIDAARNNQQLTTTNKTSTLSILIYIFVLFDI